MDESLQYTMFPGGHQPMYQMLGVAADSLPDQPASQEQAPYSQSSTSNGSFTHSYQPLDPQFQYDPNVFVQTQNSPPNRPFSNPGAEAPDPNSRHGSAFRLPTEEYNMPQRSSSEEKDSSMPATNRRKEQNRQAQRAFRQRKEQHVKELEQKLAVLQESYTTSQSDNERLKRELAKVATERDILRATASPSHHLNPFTESAGFLDEEPTHTGPMHFIPTDSHNFVLNSKSQSPGTPRQPGKVSSPHQINISPSTGERLLTAGDTWDYIQEHELFKNGMVDIGEFCEKLKKLAKCNGQTPAFEESAIRQAIEESVAGGRDELL